MESQVADHNHTHILTFPFPAQGHINPNLQFCKRLVAKGLKVTLITTISISHTISPSNKSLLLENDTNQINTEFISDGFDDAKKVAAQIADDIDMYMELFETNVRRSLIKFLGKTREWKCPPKVMVYDLNMPWIIDVLDQFGLRGAAYFTQSSAVANLLHLANDGVVKIPIENQLSVPGMPSMESKDAPSFLQEVTKYPIILNVLLRQFDNLSRANWVLINSFDPLEREVIRTLPMQWKVMTTGPTTPSMFLDKRMKADKDYGLYLLKPVEGTTAAWLDSKNKGSVLYASFGSLANLSKEQAHEIAYALKMSARSFIWVVREPEQKKLPAGFIENLQDSWSGLILPWCSQLEVLNHPAIGCFLTHCGWNSVLEALSIGVPMVAMPQWADQPTNAKYINDVWKVGVRVTKEKQSKVILRDEINRCISEVMDEGVKRSELQANAAKWKELSIAAMAEGGSSDKNINQFVKDVLSIK